MQLKNYQLQPSLEALGRLASLETIPVAASFRLATAIDAVASAHRVFDGQRMKLIGKYAQKNDQGQVVTNAAGEAQFDDRNQFDSDFAELLDCDVEVAVKPVPISLFGQVAVAPAALVPLTWLLTDEARA